ncbi:MAG TPA: bifunctional enoyl-CoA hydratase/phosphate acetyltransferase [Solirubrobacterales bacterium]|nr:bifunctional enoyl-CoA hydratase/phosphate acetyltransferase [Solirubrobacterales bacterium]
MKLHGRGILFGELITRAETLEPIRVAVVHPVDRDSLLGAIEAAREGLITPILVGPESRIKAVAAAHDLEISGFSLIAAEHSHEAAEKAVALARGGEVDALLKGSLHTDELMRAAVAPGTGLTTDHRMSHVFVVAVPRHARPLLITDAALNVEPDLATKRDIVQNAIALALALGIRTPKVAVLSAVETVDPRLRSSLEAAALAKMAERGQITGGLVDGPLAFDDAVSPAAARVKGIASRVAGQADVLVVPDLDSGNMLVKELDYLGGSQAAGIVIGGRVPIALTGRADGPLERVASCALAALVADASRPAPQAGDDTPDPTAG